MPRKVSKSPAPVFRVRALIVGRTGGGPSVQWPVNLCLPTENELEAHGVARRAAADLEALTKIVTEEDRALASGVAELVRIIEVEVTKDRRTVASFEPKVKAEVKSARVVCPIWGVAMAA